MTPEEIEKLIADNKRHIEISSQLELPRLLRGHLVQIGEVLPFLLSEVERKDKALTSDRDSILLHCLDIIEHERRYFSGDGLLAANRIGARIRELSPRREEK